MALTVGLATATAGSGGNSANAKRCQKGGWRTLYTLDGRAFASEEACVSYAAQGNTLSTKPKSQIDCELADGTYLTGYGGWGCGNYLSTAGVDLAGDCLAEVPGGHYTVGNPDAGTQRVGLFACIPPT
jgi:hypothetical protein